MLEMVCLLYCALLWSWLVHSAGLCRASVFTPPVHPPVIVRRCGDQILSPFFESFCRQHYWTFCKTLSGHKQHSDLFFYADSNARLLHEGSQDTSQGGGGLPRFGRWKSCGPPRGSALAGLSSGFSLLTPELVNIPLLAIFNCNCSKITQKNLLQA